MSYYVTRPGWGGPGAVVASGAAEPETIGGKLRGWLIALGLIGVALIAIKATGRKKRKNPNGRYHKPKSAAARRARQLREVPIAQKPFVVTWTDPHTGKKMRRYYRTERGAATGLMKKTAWTKITDGVMWRRTKKRDVRYATQDELRHGRVAFPLTEAQKRRRR